MKHYFLSSTIAGEKFEKEVSVEEYCRAERAAGFRPKMSSSDSHYITTTATGGFSSSYGISGSCEVDCIVTADHSVPARIIERMASYKEASVLVSELERLGYENVKIEIDD